MSEEIKSAPVAENPGAALVRKRWERATAEEKAEVGRMLTRARRLAARRRNRKGRKASE